MAKGFFSFSIKDDGLYCTVYPATATQMKPTMDDILYYADKVKIPECDLTIIRSLLESSNEEPATARVGGGRVFSSNEFGKYTIDTDSMTARAVFYPGFDGAGQLTEEEIQRDLANLGIKVGIKKEVIAEFVKERVYGKEYIVALGRPVREGRDGYITYNFEAELKPVPKIADDGTVDFKNIDNLNHVKKGDVVATITPEDRGNAGEDIYGRNVMPKRVRRVIFKHGKNLHISEDGLSLVSDVSGHVTLEGDKVFVSDVLTLVNVDVASGNIDYEGNVDVSGNVAAGFSIKATGNVMVRGIVEGATIVAGGDITLVRGVQGMNKAVLIAGGNIVSKFIESAESVTAGGNIESDSILHSKVVAQGKITVDGRNGLIIGGDVKATKFIEVKTIGNEMGTATTVGVGVDATLKKRVDVLKKEIEQQGNNKLQLDRMLTALRKKQEVDGRLEPDKQEMLQKTMRNLLLIEQTIVKDKKELDEIRAHLAEDSSAKIRVNNTAYVGTKLVFGDLMLFLKQKYDYCQFVKEGADIKSIPI